jgi:hypothetical protein
MEKGKFFQKLMMEGWAVAVLARNTQTWKAEVGLRAGGQLGTHNEFHTR